MKRHWTATARIALPATAIALFAFGAAPATAVGNPFDPTFGAGGRVTTDFGGNDEVGDVAVLPDGKVVAVGTRGGTFGNFAVARYNTNGTLDSGFSGDGKADNGGGTGVGARANAVAIQPDGKLVLAGDACGLGGCDFHLQRYNADGSLDSSFHSDGIVSVGVGGLRSDHARSVTIQPDGKIVAAGQTCDLFFEYCDVAVMRFNSDGSLDGSFGGGIVVSHLGAADTDDIDLLPDNDVMQVSGVAVQSDGTIVVVGTYVEEESEGGFFRTPKILLARYGTAGGLLGTPFARYVDGSMSTANGLAVQSDGSLVVAGLLNNFTSRLIGVARFDAGGSFDPSFDSDGRLTTAIGSIGASDVALQPGGGIVVTAPSGALGHILRYDSSGTLDPLFSGDGHFSATFAAENVAIAPDGKIVVAGTFAGDFEVTRFAANGGDGTAPVLSLPGNLTAEATSPAGAVVSYSATATDNEDTAPDVACSPASGSTFALGTTTVACSATDDAGNSSTGSFTVRVADTVAPTVFTAPIRVNATSAAGAVVTYVFLVHDDVDTSPSVDCAPPSGSLFPIGLTIGTCTASDASGNNSSRTFRVTVVGFRDQVGAQIDAIAALPLTGQADVRRDNAQHFCENAYAAGNWASSTMPKTNDSGRYALLQIRQCVLYLTGPPLAVQTASAAIRLALINLVCTIAHLRYDEVLASGGANASRLVQARMSLDQADADPGTNGALFDCVSAWSVLMNEPPQYTS